MFVTTRKEPVARSTDGKLMQKKVAINAQISLAHPGGVETNTASLLAAMGESGDISICALSLPKHSFELSHLEQENVEIYPWKHGQESVPKLSRNRTLSLKILKFLGTGKVLYQRVLFHYQGVLRDYRLLSRGKPKRPTNREVDKALDELDVEVIHFPSPQYFPTKKPFIYEPWDLQYLHYPEFFTREEYEWRDYAYRKGCQQAALIVTATKWVKDDIVEKFGIASEKIAVIPRASNLAGKDLTSRECNRLISEAGVNQEFIFYPAMTFEHKNHTRLMQALALLRDEKDIRIKLVLTGRPFPAFWPSIENEIMRLGLQNSVQHLGVVSDELLTALFRKAKFMVFPSLFEGLGLPLLEAFRNGTPVLASRETCIPEVVGDAATLFDAKSVNSIADAIYQAFNSPDRLKLLQAKGYARLEDYHWSKAGPAFEVCYKKIMDVPLARDEEMIFSQLIG